MYTSEIIRDLIGIVVCIGFMLFAYAAGYKDGRESKIKGNKTCPICKGKHSGIQTVCDTCYLDVRN